jgi:hypothetical protein
MEKKVLVKVFRIQYICDFCHEGFMTPVQGVLTVTMNTAGDSLVSHECTKCKAVQWLPCAYPRIAFEEINDQPNKNATPKVEERSL